MGRMRSEGGREGRRMGLVCKDIQNEKEENRW